MKTWETSQRDSLHYLGSIIRKDGESDEDVKHRMKVGWLKRTLAFEVLCDRRMPTRSKGMFYSTTIRPTMTYGAECWPIKEQHVYTMNVEEMRMLR